VVLVVDQADAHAARLRGANRVRDEVADLPGQADVVEGELERLARGLDEVDDPACDVVGGLTAVGQLVEVQAHDAENRGWQGRRERGVHRTRATEDAARRRFAGVVRRAGFRRRRSPTPSRR
jgi:hypothetical protein